MKKMFSFFAAVLVLCTLLSACSGGGAIPLTGSETAETEAADITATKETDAANKDFPFVPHVTTWDEINAIPVATPEMSVDELRQICVDYASLQQNFYWTPTHRLDYICEAAGDADADGKLHIKVGDVYGGLPYGGGGMSLYSAMDYYDEKTGVFDTSSFTGKNVNTMSNHCSSSIMWGFMRVSTTVNYHGTVTMLPVNGCIPIGPYTYDQTLERFDVSPDTFTRAICTQNGEQTMFESYALLQKADGVVTYLGEGIGGHTRMILEDATVVRSADGTIDGDQSFVRSVEQYSTKTNIEVSGATVVQHGEPNKKYTFREMFKSGYVPFTIPEFCGMAKVEKAHAELNVGADATIDQLKTAILTSNYAIAKVYLNVLDENGNVVSSTVRHIADNPVRTYDLTKLLSARFLSDVAGKRMQIQAFVGSGELLTAFDGTVS